jgi:hypothetical protein
MVDGCTFIRYCIAVVVFAVVVLVVVVPLFCVLGSVASYCCACYYCAMLLPSELVLTSLLNYCCLAC